MSDVTQLLNAINRGDPKSSGQLLEMVYGELCKLAACIMASEIPGQTLQPNALVHEARLRITKGEDQVRENRPHCFAAAAEAMRRILIENARRKKALRHGAGQRPLDLQELEFEIEAPAPDDQLLAIDEALDRFAAVDKQKAELVKLRFFCGMSIEQAAAVLRISEATAKRWWAYARAWLYAECQR